MPELLPYTPGSPEWLAARRQGVTATDIVTILGLSSWSSPYSLFWQKMGQAPETPDSDRFRLGRTLEPYVIERWAEEHPGKFLSGGALWRSDARPWQLATLDKAIWTGEHGGPLEGVLEIKTWADADKPAWQAGPPAAVRVQNLWQMDTMDSPRGHVGVVFLPSGEFRSYAIEHDEACGTDLCSVCLDIGLMVEAGEEFMQRLRLELPAPDPDASAATLAAVKARFAKAPDKQAEIDRDQWARYIDWKDELDQTTKTVRMLEIGLREQAGEASVLTVDGQPVARRITGDAQVKAHTRHSDYLKRIKTEADDNA